jgi:O-antigen/teichoic acid export membrane protein
MNSKIPSIGQYIRGTVLVFMGNIMGMVSIFIARVISANYLSTSNYGSLILGISMINIISIFVLMGFPTTLAQRLPRVERESEYFRDMLIIALVLSIIIILPLTLFDNYITQYLGDGGFDKFYIIFIFTVPFIVAMELSIGVSRGFEDSVGKIIISSIGNKVFTLILLIIMVTFHLKPDFIIYSWVGAYVIASLIGVLYVDRRYKLISDAGKRIAPDPQRSKSILKFSIPLMLSSGVVLMLNYGDNILIGYFLDSRSVGVYDIAYTLGNILLVGTSAFKFLFVPRFSKLHSDGDTSALSVFYQFVTRWIVFLSLPLFLVYILFPETIITQLFGNDYIGGITPLRILSIGFFIHLILGLNAAGLVASGYSGLILKGNVISLGANIVLNIILIPLYGIVGAAAASAISYSLINVFYQYHIIKYVKINPYPKRAIPIIGITSLIFVGAWLIISLIPSSSILLLVGLLLVASIIHLIIVAVFGIRDEEKKYLIDIKKKLI